MRVFQPCKFLPPARTGADAGAIHVASWSGHEVSLPRVLSPDPLACPVSVLALRRRLAIMAEAKSRRDTSPRPRTRARTTMMATTNGDDRPQEEPRTFRRRSDRRPPQEEQAVQPGLPSTVEQAPVEPVRPSETVRAAPLARKNCLGRASRCGKRSPAGKTKLLRNERLREEEPAAEPPAPRKPVRQEPRP